MNKSNLVHGLLAGLAGGAVFGMMMGMMGTLPMIGKMVGIPSPAVGFIVHMGISASIGASFAILFSGFLTQFRTSMPLGMIYGAVWWFLGPLTLMPLFLGMGLGVNWNAMAATNMLPSLGGHLLFGLITGASYTWIQRRKTEQYGQREYRTASSI